eukprot:3698385-Amphidinium_carterae.1
MEGGKGRGKESLSKEFCPPKIGWPEIFLHRDFETLLVGGGGMGFLGGKGGEGGLGLVCLGVLVV